MTEAEVVAMGWCPKPDCQCDAALHVKPNLPVGTEADVSPVTDDTPNERRARPLHCKCEAFKLHPHSPWVALPDVIHTPERCGYFEGVTATRKGLGPTTLAVIWTET